MPIRPQDVDPAIQDSLKERFAQIFSPGGASDPIAARVRSAGTKAWRETAKRFTHYYIGAGMSFVTGIVSAAVLEKGSEGLAGLAFLLFFALAGTLVYQGFTRTQKELTRYINPDAMRGAAHLVALSRAEKLYCEAVASLADAGSVLGDAVQAEFLAQLNSLLASYRKLDAPVQQLRAASGGDAVEELERELAELVRRRDAQDDEGARMTMSQSIGLCTQRLEQARALRPVCEKAEAQQELILQSLASVQASLVRMGAVSPEGHPTLRDTEVEGLRQSVSQVTTQTRAVEEAVVEVVRMGN